MLIIKHTIETTASPEDIWHLWQDVENWHTWDYATDYCSLDGPFKEGAKGKWKSKGGPLLPIKLTRVEPLNMFVVEYKLFFARIVNSHYLTKSGGKTQVTQQIEIRGPLAFLFAYHLGRTMKKDLPLEMEAMAKKAETLSKEGYPRSP